ncbi:MAG: flagellar basal body P-ring formation chaperone FlgA [Verrucomicrobiota bacterium]
MPAWRHRRFNIWARVRISVQFERVVASRTLKRGELIEAASLRMQRMEGFSLRRDFAKTFDEVVGWVPIVAIREGTTILKTQIEPPKEVEKGQILQVEAQQGKVYLKLEGLGETSGRTGELVLVRNPQNGRTFRARVQAPGKVTVK